MSNTAKNNEHAAPLTQKLASMLVSLLVNGGIFLLFALSSGSSESSEALAASQNEQVFCRYIENGRMYNVEIAAPDWQNAEEQICGAHYRDVRLGSLLVEGAKLILDNGEHPILLAQRESCSCSKEERVPVLQDIGIVEAPRLGAETKKTALPRIINTPEPSQANTVTTVDNKNNVKKNDKPTKKSPSIDDLLNAASQYDEARPISDIDPGGSADGSRLSKSATGSGDPYLQKVKAKLDNSMNAPASIPKTQLQKLKAQIWINIGDSGILYGWDFVKKSGNDAFDKMIEMTLKQFMMGGNKRFTSPPDQWKLKRIGIVVDGSDIR